MLVPVVLLAYHQAPREVELPVYDKPVTFFQEGKQALLVGDAPNGLTGLSAAECGRCHADQHAQWKDSAHGQASTEPVFAAAFQAEQRFVCRSCHSPLQEQHPRLVHQFRKAPNVLLHGTEAPSGALLAREFGPQTHPGSFVVEPNRQYSATLATEGVNCAACHVREGTVLTAKPTGSSRAPHSLSYSPQMSKADYCGGCHQFNIQNPSSHPFEKEPALASVLQNSKGRRVHAVSIPVPGPHGLAVSPVPTSGACDNGTEPPICPIPELEIQYQQEPRDQETFDEFKSSPAALRGETCQSCHMPAGQAKSPSHNWPGRDDLTMLRKAVSLQARLAQSEVAMGDTLEAVIEVKNEAGHRFPTGDSIHAGIVDVWLRDGTRTLSRRAFALAKQPDSLAITQAASGLVNVVKENAAPSVADETSLTGPTGRDTRVKAGASARLRFRQKVDRRIAAALEPIVEVRVYYSAVHPGFRGSRIDPKLKPLRLIREEVLPVKVSRQRVASGK